MQAFYTSYHTILAIELIQKHVKFEKTLTELFKKFPLSIINGSKYLVWKLFHDYSLCKLDLRT